MTDKKPDTRSHEHVLTIDAPPETVWKAITEAGELTRWFPLAAKTAPGEGGHITYEWAPDLKGACRIHVWEPPNHLRTSWVEVMAEEGGDQAARRQLVVDWFIEGKAGRTALRLVHSGFSKSPGWDDEYDATRRGWDYELRSLKHYLERHPGHERRAFWLRQPVKLTAGQIWKRLTAPGGLVKEGRLDSLGAGDHYSVTLACGDRLEGNVLINMPPTAFAGTVENLNGGLFRLGYEPLCGAEATIWLSTWGVPAAEVQETEKRWRTMLADVFA